MKRRDFLKSSAGALASLAAPTVINYLGESSPSSDKEFLEVKGGRFYMGGEKYTINGANYLTRDNPWKMFEKFAPNQIEKELEIAENLGINTLRVGLMHPYSVGRENPEEIPRVRTQIDDDYFQNFTDFLDIADDKNMKIMPIVFNYTPWAYFKTENHELGRDYLENWLPEFKDDERILAWDVKNEPEIHQKYFERKGKSKQYDIPSFTKKMAKEIDDLDQNHPVTIGLSDTHAEPGKVEENLIGALPKYINDEDFYSFHYYVPLKFFDQALKKIRNKTDKPILLQEFGLPTIGTKYLNEDKQKWYFRKILGKLNEEGLNNSLVWELNDHPSEVIEEDNPYAPKNERIDDFGILNTDYSKKPAAYVVQQYYNWIL